MRGLLLFLLLNLPLTLWSQDNDRFLQRVGIAGSFDDALDGAFGLNVFVEKDVYSWKRGVVYLRLGSYYGFFPGYANIINQYTTESVNLFQPLRLELGHQFSVVNNIFSIRLSLLASPSFYRHKITIDDDRLDINKTYSYSHSEFALHYKVGLYFQTNSRYSILLFMNLPIVNKNVVRGGGGLSILYDLPFP